MNFVHAAIIFNSLGASFNIFIFTFLFLFKRDLDRLLSEETGLPVLVAEDPLTCVVRGCGIALERMERLGSIFTSE